jgi:hypothetical protein
MSVLNGGLIVGQAINFPFSTYPRDFFLPRTTPVELLLAREAYILASQERVYGAGLPLRVRFFVFTKQPEQ